MLLHSNATATCLVLLLLLQQTHQSTITTPSGLTIVGTTVDNNCNQYLAIPYAAPPTHDNRWLPPTPYQKNRPEEVVNATQFPPVCMQPPNAWPSLDSTYMSEDCLYVNVFTPTTYDPQSMPVMVYIHGGDYLYGGTNDKEINGCNLVAVTRDVVVVTVQYRLGIFGFLGSETLRDRDTTTAQPSTGNYGLLDQIEALRWINKNIGVFGGDTNNVMIFGESAGAGAITNLLVAPTAKHLYHRAAMQSGAWAEWTTKSMQNATDVFNDLVQRSTCAPTESSGSLVDCLLALSPNALVDLSLDIQAYADQWTVCRWSPTVDGSILLEHPAVVVLKDPSQINPIPILYGNNDEEGVSFVSMTRMSDSAWIEKETFQYNDFQTWLTVNFPTNHRLIQQHYHGMFDEGGTTPPQPWFVAQRIVGDLMLFCPGRRSAKSLMRHREETSVYEYLFDHAPYLAGTANTDSFHGAEVPFVFSNLKEVKEETGNGGRGEFLLAQSMTWLWTMFAKFGTPTPTQVTPPSTTLLNDLVWAKFPAYLEMDTAQGGLNIFCRRCLVVVLMFVLILLFFFLSQVVV